MRSVQTADFTVYSFQRLPEEQVDYDIGHMAKMFMLNTLRFTSINQDVFDV